MVLCNNISSCTRRGEGSLRLHICKTIRSGTRRSGIWNEISLSGILWVRGEWYFWNHKKGGGRGRGCWEIHCSKRNGRTRATLPFSFSRAGRTRGHRFGSKDAKRVSTHRKPRLWGYLYQAWAVKHSADVRVPVVMQRARKYFNPSAIDRLSAPERRAIRDAFHKYHNNLVPRSSAKNLQGYATGVVVASTVGKVGNVGTSMEKN